MTATKSIREYLNAIPIGRPFATGSLVRFGTRAAVDQALSRLEKDQEILRVARGIYVKPRLNSILGRIRPGIFEVAQAITEAEGAKLAIHGAAWALKFGLTTQVMTSSTYLTDGRDRRLHVGKALLTLRHASPLEMRLAEKPSGRAILALRWLNEPASPRLAMEKLWAALPPNEWEEFRVEALAEGGWIAKAIKGFKPSGKAKL